MTSDENSSMKHLIAEITKEAKDLKSRDEEDLPCLVSNCRALIQTNDEIWGRCKPSYVWDDSKSNKTTEDCLQFYRFGYQEVQVTTDTPTGRNCQVNIVAKTGVAAKSYSGLPDFPKHIRAFFHIDSATGSNVLFDYNACLEKILCLKENLAELFLLVLKEHLKTVQVFLGGIETWLLETGHALQFIRETFGCHLNPLELGNGCDLRSCLMQREDHEVCLGCFQTKESHGRNAENHPRCNGGMASFHMPTTKTLKTIRLISRLDVFEANFHICSAEDQERLKRLLHFFESSGTSPPPAPPASVSAPSVQTMYYVGGWDTDSS